MINCFTCGAAIIMTDMQEHQETHQQGETKQPEDDFEFSAGQCIKLAEYHDPYSLYLIYVINNVQM